MEQIIPENENTEDYFGGFMTKTYKELIEEISSDEWKHSYSRKEAAFPKTYLKEYKYWAPVARVDNVYGDKNLFCSCPSMDEYKETAA